MTTRNEKALIFCLQETQTLLVRLINDPTSTTYAKATKHQFDLNNLVIDKVEKGA